MCAVEQPDDMNFERLQSLPLAKQSRGFLSGGRIGKVTLDGQLPPANDCMDEASLHLMAGRPWNRIVHSAYHKSTRVHLGSLRGFDGIKPHERCVCIQYGRVQDAGEWDLALRAHVNLLRTSFAPPSFENEP